MITHADSAASVVIVIKSRNPLRPLLNPSLCRARNAALGVAGVPHLNITLNIDLLDGGEEFTWAGVKWRGTGRVIALSK